MTRSAFLLALFLPVVLCIQCSASVLVTSLSQSGIAQGSEFGNLLQDQFSNNSLPPVSDVAAIPFYPVSHQQTVNSYATTANSLALDLQLVSEVTPGLLDFPQAFGNFSLSFTLSTAAALTYTANAGGPNEYVSLQKDGNDVFSINDASGSDVLYIGPGNYLLSLSSFADDGPYSYTGSGIDLFLEASPIPEPATCTLALIGLCLASKRRR
ncbi:MAG: hypothetical protein KDA57_06345 [Planctomycetales bacterium]|nr:hypothetical protein [Planctomycetales bacterium]